MYQKHVSLDYKKKQKIYTNSTGSLTFNPETLEAYSYKWWKFVAKIENKIVFNNYSYSVTTSKHQSKVRRLLEELNIKVDLYLPLPRGIESSSLEDLIVKAEEALCDKLLNEELKKQERNAKAKARREEYKKTKEYHETQFNKKAETFINKEVTNEQQ